MNNHMRGEKSWFCWKIPIETKFPQCEEILKLTDPKSEFKVKVDNFYSLKS